MATLNCFLHRRQCNGAFTKVLTLGRLFVLIGFVVALVLSASPVAAQSSPNPLDGFIGSLTKGAKDALQKGIEGATGQTSTSPSNSTSSEATGSKPGTTYPVTPPSPSTQHSGAEPGAGAARVRANMEAMKAGSAEKIPAAIQKSVDDFRRGCHTGSYLGNLHDCDCLTQGFRKILEAKNSPQISPEETYALGQTCPAPKATIYAWVNQNCDDYMQHTRTDHVEFCRCTADRFSTSFQSSPNSNIRKVEALRRESEKACGLGDQSTRIRH